MRHLWVAGPALRGSGYPNAEQTMEILRASGEWLIDDHADWLPPDTRLWQLASGSVLQRLRLVLRLGISGWWQATKAILGARRDGWVYVPYPAPFTLWWMSFCPRYWRPRCLADAYISIWDSMFRDRRIGAMGGLLSRLARRFERRSMRAAHCVLVDTEANRLQLIDDFGLEPGSVVSLPLAIDEQMFLEIVPYVAASGTPLRVLFVGTLVALHGIEVVLAAIEALEGDSRFDFRLIGDGQMSSSVEKFVAKSNPRNFTWVREWHGLQRIAKEIEEADVCLGVFGADGKSARVLPFKLYMYLAAGRPIITQSALSVPQNVPMPPCRTVDARDASALANALDQLAGSAITRDDLAARGRKFYLRSLSNQMVAAHWRANFLN